jgi:hypothetical protein
LPTHHYAISCRLAAQNSQHFSAWLAAPILQELRSLLRGYQPKTPEQTGAHGCDSNPATQTRHPAADTPAMVDDESTLMIANKGETVIIYYYDRECSDYHHHQT